MSGPNGQSAMNGAPTNTVIQADEDDGVTVWVDEESFDQILDNLIDNALKYTTEGGRIHVTWRKEGEFVGLEVADTGIGIAESDLAAVFERFYRVDRARSRELGGTGLGLSIVKHLVQAMRGSVRHEPGEPGDHIQRAVALSAAQLKRRGVISQPQQLAQNLI